MEPIAQEVLDLVELLSACQFTSLQRVEPSRAVVKNLSFRCRAYFWLLDDGLGGAGPPAVEVAVIRGEDQPIVADHVDDVGQFTFIRLERKVELAALQETARFPLEIRQLHAEDFVMFIQAVKPVGEPTAAGFQKNKPQLGKAIENAFADDHG